MKEQFTKDQTESRFIGVAIGLPLHRALKDAAAKENMSLSALPRQSLVEKLQRSEGKRKRKDEI
jgi:hypothetical protein